MAAKLFQLVIFFLTFFTSLSLISAIETHSSSSTTVTFTSPSLTSTTSPPPPSQSPFPYVSSEIRNSPQFLSPLTSITHILAELGFHDFAMASRSLSLSSESQLPWHDRPVTVFAPVDSSVRTCSSCSLPILLQEHSVPGLYPSDYLSNLISGTKLETIFAGRCLTVSSAVNGSKIFIGGAEVTRPDLYVSDSVIIHGVQGFISHLSPYSCSTEKMKSLHLPHPHSPASVLTRTMLIDAMLRLRTSGYSVLALAIRVKFPELVTLDTMTIFAVDDTTIFHGGHGYVHSVRYHIIPNRLLKISDLESLPVATLLPTLESGEYLTITNTGGGDPVSQMRINYVKIRYPNFLSNSKLVVHGLSIPFPHLRHQSMSLTVGQVRQSAVTTTTAPSPVMKSTAEIDDAHQGL